MYADNASGNAVLFKAVAPQKTGIILFLILLILLPYSLCYSSYTSIFVSPDGTGDGSSPSTPTLFQNALDAAHNYDSVLICLLADTYDLTGITLSYTSAENEKVKIMIRGGYGQDGLFTGDPALTALDGKGVSKIMRLSSKAANADLTVEISNISFINGSCSDDLDAETVDNGAAISAHEGNASLAGTFHLLISACVFSENSAGTSYSGGAIYSNASLTVSDCFFDHNSGANGGAIIVYAGPDGDQTRNCYIRNCVFHENMNNGNQGSTIWHNLTLNVDNCQFFGMEDGSLVGPGSCIWGNNGSTHKISRCMFRDIKVKYWGSAIQSFGGHAYIDNCLFFNNKAGEEYGVGDGYGTVAFYHNNQPATVKRITNCTFVNNRSRFSTSSGGAIHNRGLADDDFLITNCVFDNNGQLPVYSTGTIGTIRYSCIMATYSGFTDGGGMSALAPGFADEEFHLSETSPCLNSGLNEAEPASLKDLEGNRRILNTTIDMGALELNHAPYDLALSDTLLPENSGSGFVLGTLTATEDDPEDAAELVFEFLEGDGSNDADNDKFSIEGNQLITLVNADFEEEEEWNILVGVSDFGSLSDTCIIRIKIGDENDPVILQGTIEDQELTIGEQFSYIFAEDLFTDQDPGDVLSYSARQTDGSELPSWLGLEGATRTFSGNSAGQPEGTITIRLTASDEHGSEAYTDFSVILSFPEGSGPVKTDQTLVFPNPADDFVTLRFPDIRQGSLRVSDLSGRFLIGREFSGSELILDIRALDAGTYLLMIRSEGCNRTFHLIKL